MKAGRILTWMFAYDILVLKFIKKLKSLPLAPLPHSYVQLPLSKTIFCKLKSSSRASWIPGQALDAFIRCYWNIWWKRFNKAWIFLSHCDVIEENAVGCLHCSSLLPLTMLFYEKIDIFRLIFDDLLVAHNRTKAHYPLLLPNALDLISTQFHDL